MENFMDKVSSGDGNYTSKIQSDFNIVHKSEGYLSFSVSLKSETGKATAGSVIIFAKKLEGEQSFGEKVLNKLFGRIKVTIGGETYLVKAKHVAQELGISKKEIREQRRAGSNESQFNSAADKAVKMDKALNSLKSEHHTLRNLGEKVTTYQNMFGLTQAEGDKLKKTMEKEIIHQCNNRLKQMVRGNAKETNVTLKNKAITIGFNFGLDEKQSVALLKDAIFNINMEDQKPFG